MADFALVLKRSTRYEAALKEAGFTVACAAVLEFAAINASVLAEVSVLIRFSLSPGPATAATPATPFHDIRSVPCLIIHNISLLIFPLLCCPRSTPRGRDRFEVSFSPARAQWKRLPLPSTRSTTATQQPNGTPVRVLFFHLYYQ